MVCPCCLGQCCCTGTSLNNRDIFGNPNGETCIDVSDLGPGQQCSGDVVSRPNPAQSCTGATAVIEWCGLTLTLECGVTNTGQVVGNYSASWPFPFPPFLCTTPNGQDITSQTLWGDLGNRIRGNNAFEGKSQCAAGCWTVCGQCIIGFTFQINENPTQGGAADRQYYAYRRSGCDDDVVIEKFSDTNVEGCCPEEPQVTVTFAP